MKPLQETETLKYYITSGIAGWTFTGLDTNIILYTLNIIITTYSKGKWYKRERAASTLSSICEKVQWVYSVYSNPYPCKVHLINSSPTSNLLCTIHKKKKKKKKKICWIYYSTKWATLIGWSAFASELLSKDLDVSESYKHTSNHCPCLQWYVWAKTLLHLGHIVSDWWEISYFAFALFCFGKQSDSLLRSTLTVMRLGTCFFSERWKMMQLCHDGLISNMCVIQGIRCPAVQRPSLPLLHSLPGATWTGCVKGGELVGGLDCVGWNPPTTLLSTLPWADISRVQDPPLCWGEQKKYRTFPSCMCPHTAPHKHSI